MKITLSNPFVIIFLAGTFLSFFIKNALEFADWRARVKNGGNLPDSLKKIPASRCFDEEKLKKIVEYENAKYFAWIPCSIASLFVSLALVFSGFYPWLFETICRLTDFPQNFSNTYICALLFMVLSSIPDSILSIPFDLYAEFHIERKFGFSHTTLKLWILDGIKSTVLSLILSAVLIAAMIAIFQFFPHTWWIFLTAVMFAFTLIMQILYPLVIAPLFNTFVPLEDGELKTRITNLINGLGFTSSGIFVVDASKRSGHSNAYFTGIGKSKRVVLYDTLVKQLTVDELEAVLGHEFGHYKLRHILKKICFILPLELIVMLALYFIAHCPLLYSGFGFSIATEHIVFVQFIGLFLASLVAEGCKEIISPLTNFFSRRDEYAADAFSANLTKNPDALISGLIKLNSENLKELLPPKIYVIWNYSHPTLVERVNALMNRFSGK
ncbi:MAG: M48 family metallopeptidase [Treponema sp.]|nr:M48 family metallopeptidase [Treponema sp.]